MSTVHFEIYIDRDFVKSVDEQQFAYNSHPDLQDFYRFLTKLQGVDVITNYESLDEFDRIVDTSPFWLRLYDGSVVPRIQQNFCGQLDKKEFYESSTGFKLFFVERDDVDVLSRKFGLLYINSSNLLKTWRFFSDERDDLALPITDNPNCNPRFASWSYLKNFKHPFNSLIICDRYVLQNKGAFRTNLFPLFQSLPCVGLQSSNLEIIIISELTQGKVIKHNDIDEYATVIKQQLMNWMQIKNLNLTVLKLTNNEAFYREHGRALITNYWYINPQNSFNFFRYDRATGKTNLTLSDTIDFRFVFRKPTRNLLKERLRVINDIVTHTHDSPEMKKVYSSGTKSSRLLST